MHLPLPHEGFEVRRRHGVGKKRHVGARMFLAETVIRRVINPHRTALRGVHSCGQARRVDRDRVFRVQRGLWQDLGRLSMICGHDDGRVGMRLCKGHREGQRLLKLLNLSYRPTGIPFVGLLVDRGRLNHQEKSYVILVG